MIHPTDVNIGDTLIHNKVGKIEVKGISLHCGNDKYAITYIGGWVYLHNCTSLQKAGGRARIFSRNVHTK